MFGLEVPEILLILVVFGLLFGSDKIGKFAQSLGRASGEFKKGQIEVEKEIQSVKESLSDKGSKRG